MTEVLPYQPNDVAVKTRPRYFRFLHKVGTIDDAEDAHISKTFPYNLVMKVVSSEPRDVLQSERTCLTFIRFSTALFFTALGIILNFKFDTSGEPDHDKHRRFSHKKYSIAISYILLILSFLVLLVSGVNYFITINRYARHKIDTYNFNNFTTAICITGIILTLVAINITMIIEGYLETS
ncbi:uncharacterized protein KGF55_003579 [Candida pseudojiufengensis]|uniref:uncharacterized protein n=1 Tax=Candida pseudojiufengensis TaxID=497109 RepID=UPI0022247DC3|nr:uncharacterized protein KGF55_003579 [Candida pseudojiufengensis]KAI5962503.1 hypothetical protein KGF55_003579 [Candida pseudojiufengensis]